MTPATAGAPYQVPPEPSRWSAIALAVVVHGILLFFLWFGIRWTNTPPVAVEAEVWDMKVQQAAPAPRPELQPAPEPPPRPQPKVEEPPAPKPPDIALEREKLRKKELEQKKLAEEKKLAEDKARQDKLAKQKKAAEDKRLAKLREDEIRRITGQAATSTTGGAAKSTGPKNDSGYVAALTAKIKSNIVYAGSRDVPGNPSAIYRITQLPTGEIIGFKKLQSSGVPEYDRAVEQAIQASSPLPKKKDGTVERTIEPIFKLKEE